MAYMVLTSNISLSNRDNYGHNHGNEQKNLIFSDFELNYLFGFRS